LLCHAAVVARPSPKKGTFVVLVPVGVSIQEHWLLSLEKKILENMHKDFNVSAKAVDNDDIKLNYKSLR
jgi:hypothetical protein